MGTGWCWAICQACRCRMNSCRSPRPALDASRLGLGRGLLNVLLPGLHFGVPVVARRFEKFDAEAGLALIERMGIRNIFVPPTALRMLRAVPDIPKRFRLNLRSVGSGGEALGAETFAWGRDAWALRSMNSMGQTECNLVLASVPLPVFQKPAI